MKTISIAAAVFLTICAGAETVNQKGPAGDSIEVASGLLTRSLDTRGGHVLGKSYKTANGTEFMRAGSPEFAFHVDGRMYAGHSSWTDVASELTEGKDGSRTTRVTGVSSDGQVGIELTYTTYPGIALVRKTLAIANMGAKDIAIENVDVETFRLATLGCTNSRVMRRFARYREEGSTYIGDWNDPLIVVHDYARRCGIAVGNEGVSTMKRTTAFQDGGYIVSGTPHVGEQYPFRKWLKPGERWTAMPVFTAPYADSPAPSRVVEGAVSDYVRRMKVTRGIVLRHHAEVESAIGQHPIEASGAFANGERTVCIVPSEGYFGIVSALVIVVVVFVFIESERTVSSWIYTDFKIVP